MRRAASKHLKQSEWELLENRTLLTGYTATDLGLYRVAGVNASDQVVGSKLSDSLSAAFWDGSGKIRQAGSPAGTVQSYGMGINTAGDVVGYAEGNYPPQHAILWKNGKLSELPEGPNAASEADAISDSGIVVGAVYSAASATDQTLVDHPAIWQNNTLTTLGPAGTRGIAHDINKSGTIVGETPSSAFMYSDGKMTILPTVGNPFLASAVAVNDSGEAVGSEFLLPNGLWATLWSGGKATNLGTLADTNTSLAEDINNSGTVVGGASAPGIAIAFLWTAAGKMVDLNSFFPGANFELTNAVSINDKGQIVAVGQTLSDGATHTYLLSPPGVSVIVPPPPPPPAPPAPKPVTPPPPATSGYADFDLNAVAGSMLNEAGMIATMQKTTKSPMVAAMSDAVGDVTLIGAPKGGGSSIATDIDEANEVVGDSISGTTGVHTAFLWHAGKLSALLHQATEDSRATAMNDKGAVVGSIQQAGKKDIAMLWANKTVKSLGTLGGNFSDAYDINNAGQIVGESNTSAIGAGQPFLYTGGKMTKLPMLPGATSGVAKAINDAGKAAGSTFDSANKLKAVTWSAGKIANLGTLPGDDSSFANDVNASGTVVGQSSAGGENPRAFVWTPAGHMVDLNSFFKNATYTLIEARSINAKGQIVAIGRNAAGTEHVFLVTPWWSATKAAVTTAPATGVVRTSVITGQTKKTDALLLGSDEKSVLA